MEKLFLHLILLCHLHTVLSGRRSCSEKSDYKYRATTRTVCIAAVEVEWNYAPRSSEDAMDLTGLYETEAQGILTPSDVNIGPLYKKFVYREYFFNSKKKVCDWTNPVNHDDTIGLMGPTLRVVIGDKLKVHFNNMCSAQSHSVVPQGLSFQQVRTSCVAKLIQ